MFRAEVVGSMLRPTYLARARAEVQAGSLTAAEFKRIEDRAVDQVIALQEGSGVEVVTDGDAALHVHGADHRDGRGIEPVEHGNPMPWATQEQGEFEWVLPMAVTSKLRKARSWWSARSTATRGRAPARR